MKTFLSRMLIGFFLVTGINVAFAQECAPPNTLNCDNQGMCACTAPSTCQPPATVQCDNQGMCACKAPTPNCQPPATVVCNNQGKCACKSPAKKRKAARLKGRTK